MSDESRSGHNFVIAKCFCLLAQAALAASGSHCVEMIGEIPDDVTDLLQDKASRAFSSLEDYMAYLDEQADQFFKESTDGPTT